VDSSGNGRDGDRRHRAARRPALPGRQRNEDTGDVGLKVVNTRSHAIRTQVDLGSKRLNGTGTVTVLTAPSRT
jgi:hypothetical protein